LKGLLADLNVVDEAMLFRLSATAVKSIADLLLEEPGDMLLQHFPNVDKGFEGQCEPIAFLFSVFDSRFIFRMLVWDNTGGDRFTIRQLTLWIYSVMSDRMRINGLSVPSPEVNVVSMFDGLDELEKVLCGVNNFEEAENRDKWKYTIPMLIGPSDAFETITLNSLYTSCSASLIRCCVTYKQNDFYKTPIFNECTVGAMLSLRMLYMVFLDGNCDRSMEAAIQEILQSFPDARSLLMADAWPICTVTFVIAYRFETA
jgi:hypothetical protein